MARKTAIVVGAGVAGLACAHALVKTGFAVKVFERNGRASGASIRNFGMIWPVGQPAETYHIAIRSREIWQDLAGSGALTLKQPGSLHVAQNKDEWRVLEEVYEVYEDQRPLRLLKAGEVRGVSSAVQQGSLVGGLFSADECIVDPREAIAGATAFLKERFEVEFHFGMHVRDVSTGYIDTSDGDRYHADVVLICSGADLEGLYPMVFSKLPIAKCKLQMMRLSAPEGWQLGPALCGGLSLIHYRSFSVAAGLNALKKRYESEMDDYIRLGIHVMICENSAGQLTVGDSHEYGHTPDPFDREEINQLILRYLKSFANVPNFRPTQTWNGVYAKLTNGSYYLLDSPEPGVFVFNALGGNGMTLSFGLAEKMLADL